MFGVDGAQMRAAKGLIARYRWLSWVAATVSICVLYLLAYGPVLSALEACGFEKLAYTLFEPAEALRYRSDLYWQYSEECYLAFRGAVSPRRRVLPNLRTRTLHWHNNGVKFEEIRFLNNQRTEDMTWDQWGQLITKGLYRDSQSWDGSFLRFVGGGLEYYQFSVEHKSNGVTTSKEPIPRQWFDIGRYGGVPPTHLDIVGFYVSYLLVPLVALISSGYYLYRSLRRLLVRCPPNTVQRITD